MLKMEKRRRRKEISVAARQYNVKYQHQAGWPGNIYFLAASDTVLRTL